MAQVVGNFFGGSLSLGIDRFDRLGDQGDNGVYVIDGWEIVDRIELDEQEIPYEFCRIGEDWDDIEFRTTGDNEDLSIHVEPSVSIDVF